MRAIDNANGAVVCGARIEMQANGEHALEDVDRRLYVRDTALLGPRSVVGHLNALLRGDREVLVPNDLPIRVGSLVEEERTDGEARVAKNGDRELPECRRRGQSSDARVVEQIASPAAAGSREKSDAVAQLRDRWSVDDGIGYCPAERGN